MLGIISSELLSPFSPASACLADKQSIQQTMCLDSAAHGVKPGDTTLRRGDSLPRPWTEIADENRTVDTLRGGQAPLFVSSKRAWRTKSSRIASNCAGASKSAFRSCTTSLCQFRSR